MNESFDDKLKRIYDRMNDFVKTLQLEFVNIDTEVDNPIPGLLKLEVFLHKDKEQLVAEKLMEAPLPAGYVKPGVYVVESDVSSVVCPDGISSLIGSAEHGPSPIRDSVHVAVPELP